MIYYIVPPIIIIASITLLVWFLFRKVSIIPQEVMQPKAETFYMSKIRAFFAAIGHFFLMLAEALIRRAKLFALKFHNTSNDWARVIRKKREDGKLIREQRSEQNRANLENQTGIDQDVAEVINSYTKEETVFESRRRIRRAQPMVSDSVTLPEKQLEKEAAREKLEDVLIKRIAMNPRDIEAYERLGDYYMEQESARDALECYRQVLKLSPAHHKAKAKIRRLERMLLKN